MPKWLNAIIVLATLLLCSLFAYCLIFSGFIDYDDEGVFLMILHLMSKGRILYDQIITIYGPVAFLPRFAIFKLLGVGFTHDAGRMMTLVNWLLTSILLGIAAWRQCRSAAWFGITTICTCVVLNRIIHEPGHPQDLCCLFIAGTILTATFWQEKRATGILLILASLGALLLMTKINLGIFFADALAATMLLQIRKCNGRTVLVCLLLAGLAGMPFFLMNDNLQTPDFLCFAIVAALAPISCAIAAFGQPGNLKLKHFMAAAGQFIVIILALFIPTALATSAHGLINGMIRFPLMLSHVFNISSPMDSWAIGVAAVGIVLALVFARSARNDPTGAIFKIAVALAGLVCVAFHAEENLLRFGPGLVWLILVPSVRGQSFLRTFAAFLAVSETLWAYPICGAQLSFAVFPYVFIAAVILSDGIAELTTLAAKPVFVARCASIAALLAAFALIATNALGTYRLYNSLVPFGLPGTSLIRVDAQKSAGYQKIVADLKRNTDFFTGLPITNSLYLWTQIEPPPWAIHTLWINTLDDAQQLQVIDSMEQHPRACLVYSEDLLAFWLQGRPLQQGKLMDYLKSNYAPSFTMAEVQGYSFQLCTRKDRKDPVFKDEP